MKHDEEKTDRSRAWRGAFMLALGMILFGSATPISKLVVSVMPAFPASLLRVSIGAASLLPFAVRRWSSVRAMNRADWARTAVIALFGMFGFTALLLHGMREISGVAGAVVMSTTPALTAIAAVLFLGESMSWRKGSAVVLAVLGVLILHLRGGSGDGAGGNVLLGVALVFGAVLCEVCYTLLGKRVSEDVDPLVVAFLASAMSIPAFLPLALWQADDLSIARLDARSIAALVAYGAGTLALGSWLWYSGVARAEGTVAAAFMGLMPVSALVLSYLLLGEDFRWIHLLGFGTVFAGVILISWEHARSGES